MHPYGPQTNTRQWLRTLFAFWLTAKALRIAAVLVIAAAIYMTMDHPGWATLFGLKNLLSY